MGLFRVNHEKFLEEVHRLIDEVDTSRKRWVNDFVARIDEAIDEHGVSLDKSVRYEAGKHTYGSQIVMRMLAGNRQGAHKLADSIGPEGNTWISGAMWAILGFAFKRILPIVIVVLVTLLLLGKL